MFQIKAFKNETQPKIQTICCFFLDCNVDLAMTGLHLYCFWLTLVIHIYRWICYFCSEFAFHLAGFCFVLFGLFCFVWVVLFCRGLCGFGCGLFVGFCGFHFSFGVLIGFCRFDFGTLSVLFFNWNL